MLPRPEEVLINMAAHFLTLNRPQDALTCCDEALRIAPHSPKAWNNKGAAFQRMSRSEEALQCFSRSVECDPRYKLGWFQKGSVLGQLGHYEEELECYETALAIDPSFIEALVGKGTALDDLGRYQEALVCYDKAITASPHNATTWLNRGNTLDHLRHFEDAVESYRRAVEIDPKLVAAWGNMANTLRELEEYEESLRCYDRALEIAPNDRRLHLGKALIYFRSERYSDAWSSAIRAKTLGSQEASELLLACMQKISPEDYDELESSLKGRPLPPEITRTAKCPECGKAITSGTALFNFHKQAYYCRDCTFASLPADGRQALLNIESDPLFGQLRWATYWQKTVPYFAYLNDQDMPPFIDQRHAEEFIYKHSIHVPISDLVRWWQKLSLVHTSITSLTHEGQDQFRIEWSEDLSAGVLSFDVYARGFCEGMLYPNIGMAGLRDLAHVESVMRPNESLEAIDFRVKVGPRTLLTEREGYAAFARSIAESLMLALHAAILKRADDEVIIRTVKKGLVSILEENGGYSEYFSEQWETQHFGEMLYEVKSAMITDRLRLQRFVQTAECFVLSLDRLARV